MDLWASFIANPQPAILVQPSNCPLNNPPMHTQPASMRRIAFGKDRSDATFSQFLSMRFGIIATVALHTLRTAPWSPRLPANGWNGIDQGDQLRHIIRIRTRH